MCKGEYVYNFELICKVSDKFKLVGTSIFIQNDLTPNKFILPQNLVCLCSC